MNATTICRHFYTCNTLGVCQRRAHACHGCAWNDQPEKEPVTQHHLLHAYAIIRPIGVSFEDAMQCQAHTALRQVIEYKAAMLCTEAWNAIFTTPPTRQTQ